MKSTHLTDEEIQQYVLDRDAADATMTTHIHGCRQCKEKAETYRLLVASLRELPDERFDFTLTELVMQQLPAATPGPKREKESVLIYSFITTGAAIIVFSLYFFRKYMTSIFESIAPVFVYLVVTAFMTLSIFLVIDVYIKYKKKIHTLDLYTG
jgi:hypothetical protein